MLQIYPGVFEMILELHEKSFQLGAVTSKKTLFARRGLEHFGLDPFFQVVVGEDEVQRHKPEPDPILFALVPLGVEPDEALMVGDAPFDILSAQAAQVRSAAVTWGAYPREQLLTYHPDFILDQIDEIVPLVERLSHE
jgi:pyrophosphatase PpaX